MKRLLLSLVFYLLSSSVGFTGTCKPWTFWYWMYGAVSREGIKADLQAMKDVGLGGCYLMPIRGEAEAPSNLPRLGEAPAQQLTPQFWAMVDYAMQQADSLGLELGIHICDGFALAGGPWISPEESMQKVVWSDSIVVVGKNGTVSLPQPAVTNAYYEDIAAFAIPAQGDVFAPDAVILSPTVTRNDKGVFRAEQPGYIQYDFNEPQAVRSLHIVPSGNNLQAQRLLVQVSDDGTIFRDIRQLIPPRQGWQNTDENYTFSLPETTSRHFRFCWTPEGTEPGSEDLDAAKWSPVLKLKELTLSSIPVIDQYEAKNGSVWRIAAPYATTEQLLSEPIRLAEGTTLAPGRYRILRFGHTTTGHTNATAGGGKGLECDKFSVSSVEKQIDSWFGAFKKRPHSSVVRYMHVDSWECGSQNWGRNFAEEFLRRRGYDLLPYMPVFAGVPMKNHEQVLRDIRLTINDLIQEVFFKTVARKAKDYGVQLSAECVAPTMVADGMQHYAQVDLPMGEFWLNSPTHDKPNDMLDAISGAHVYGKNIVQAEGFTEVRGVWDETPAMVKPLLDRNFALGINCLFFHVFTHNPYMDKKPGMTLDGIGLFFQRDQTWFPEAKGLVDYITRCQRLLQQGRPVTDIAVFTGDEMPRRALTPDRLVKMLPGLFGEERIKKEELRYGNAAFFTEESPVGVKHSAGIFDLKDWINPLHGYSYDSMNPDALLHQPFHYKALVVPESALVSVEARQRIEQLRQQGVLIIEKPYPHNTLEGIAPDVKLPEGLAYAHRNDGQTDIYFLSNQRNGFAKKPLAFRVTGKKVAVYDAEHDEYRAVKAEEKDGYTWLTLSIEGGESLFVIFADTVPQPRYSKMEGDILEFSKPWTIEFLENGKTLTTPYLLDWSQQMSDSIKYYSGRARYTSTFKYRKKRAANAGPVFLELGTVRDVAHVWLNGIDCGIAWHWPNRVDVTKAIRKGKNTLVIEVVNTWHNALKGVEAGKAPYGGIWTNARYRSKGDKLLPAGLLGYYYCYRPNSILLHEAILEK